jgi:hypothetical protein
LKQILLIKKTGSCTPTNDELNLIPYEKLAVGILGITKLAAPFIVTRQIDFVKIVKMAKVVKRVGYGLTILGIYNDSAESYNGDDNGDITLAASTHYLAKMGIVAVGVAFPLVGFGLAVADYAIGDDIEEYFAREQPILIYNRK